MEKYGFLMLDFTTPEFIRRLQGRIKENELYMPKNPEHNWSYGIEGETHVTLAPCLDNDIPVANIRRLLLPIDNYKVMLGDVSMFDCKDYDVLKCRAVCDELYETYDRISAEFEIHSEYKEYNPHVTIAYMKKGCAKKYLEPILSEQVFLTSVQFSWGHYVGDDYVKVSWK